MSEKKQKQLSALNEKMAEKCTCTLKESVLNVVSGAGNADARILFIGEAPGKKEDETGTPFMGAAGRVLNELLASIKLSREDIYITNVVKYRPPNNRDPLPEEVAACWPWLQAQINLIEPDLIIPLGRHALERFVPGRKISDDHGTVFDARIDGCGTYRVYALYHPAASIYNRKLRDTLFEDFKRIPQILKDVKN